ncbi:MAG: topoisomerase IV [Firmicutes bacterium]|nr:topoisomerase IV [Bacillota bacterium]
MAKKKKTEIAPEKENIRQLPEREVVIENYMPYAMSVITDRALPAIDGFKPAHRKLLYTMFRMGLLNGGRTKSANIAGAGMKYSPHGDAGIYETMVRLTQNNEALLMPFVDGKGNFGKVYSRDTAYAAPRYTEAKLMPICSEFFGELGKNAVDMVDNYDGTEKEPVLLPTSFPNILVSANMGIAVGMACSFPGFNFSEACLAAAEYIKHPGADLSRIMPAPDFTTGGELIYIPEEMDAIYETGKGSFSVRSVYEVDEKHRLILVREIPYSTTVEAIIDKIAELMKAGKLPQISDVRDESDLSGLAIAIDYKKGTDVDKLIEYLMKETPLTDSFACNFNLLVDGVPKTMGLKGILDEWLRFRKGAKERALQYELDIMLDRLYLLQGLEKIILDIDKAVRIVRGSATDELVIINLMKGFGIGRSQAEFVANIRLRNLNEEYILRQTREIDELQHKISSIDEILSSEDGVKNVIRKELIELADKYPMERRTRLIDPPDEDDEASEAESFFIQFTEDGYIKRAETGIPCDENTEILVFSDSTDAYKARAVDVKDKPVYAASLAELGSGENMVGFFILDVDRYVVTLYDTGKVSLYRMSDYETKLNRKKLKDGISGSAGRPVAMLSVTMDDYIVIETSKNRKAVLAVSGLSLQNRGGGGRTELKPRKKEELTGLRLATPAEIKKATKLEQMSIDLKY